MASTAKRVSRPIKREKDDKDHDDAMVDLSADASDRVPLHKAKKRGSPEKKRAARHSSEESDDSEEEDSEMSSFIAKDEEVERELIEEQERKLAKKKAKAKKLGKQRKMKALDDEDLEIIRENVGLEIPKKQPRLKKTAVLEAEKQAAAHSSQPSQSVKLEKHEEEVKEEPDAMQIDTTTQDELEIRRQRQMRIELERDYKKDRELESIRAGRDEEKLQQAHKIFGDSGDLSFMKTTTTKQEELKKAQSAQLEEVFNHDEIDDPFSSAADKKIAESDIPERLQVKLETRLKPSDQELQEEAEWILERLTSPDTEYGAKYGRLVTKNETSTKIYKVLRLIRSDHLDVPMVAHYRKYEYADELDEEAVWHIYHLDQEYGKFLRHKQQIKDFLVKVQAFDPKMKLYEEELIYAKTSSELNNFNALIRYLRSYFNKELHQNDDSTTKRKQPLKRDEIQLAKEQRIVEFASRCFLSWAQFSENLQFQRMSQRPPEPIESPATLAVDYFGDYYKEDLALFQAVCKFAALELAAQPFIRNAMKKNLRNHGYLSTAPTEQGKKDLDLFHPSYRVKLVRQQTLASLKNNTDLYLDIIQCEKAGLISVEITMDKGKEEEFKEHLEELYLPDRLNKQSWNIMRAEVIRILVSELLTREIIKEVREEIREDAENYVIKRCKQAYRELLMTGPFTTKDESLRDEQADQPLKKNKRSEGELIKDRDRLSVMGAIMHQIDANNYIVTIAVVDKYGELVAHKDFMRLLPPRKRREPQGEDRAGKPDRPQPKSEEENEHERDKAKLIEMLEWHSIDLIVVAANSLEARNLKDCLKKIAEEFKNKAAIEEENDGRQSRKSAQHADEPRKEAFVIWGATEVPKLFSMSHNSQKLHKNTQQMLKQAISLARFEQDPLTEVLNLWSPITAENQALALNLDHMQKLVNQARLAEGLEEMNILVLNEVGVDLNLLADHDHMHAQLQFVSGLGPRKAKRLITKMKSLGKKIATRGHMFKEQLLTSNLYISVVPFLKIRIPEEDMTSGFKQPFDVLDQTRIHHENYTLAMKIATDSCHTDGDSSKVERVTQHRMVKEVIQNPMKLKNLDLKQYFSQLEMTGRSNMRMIIEQIIKEFTSPFQDPRTYRSPTKTNITNERLFYLLIDESKRTFKKGIIVTATVSTVLDTKAICRLENGLNAIIPSTAILEDTNQKLREIIDRGHIISGRIESIQWEEESRFEVNLNCKQQDLQTHDKYVNDLAQSLNINKNDIPPEDLRNQNFSADQKPKQIGRFVPRRIAHEKFKNISSRRALAELGSSEVGDFVFRPSTRSEDSITLTWKFWKKHFVHIDITEQEKAPGASIGNRLIISNDYFENVREIVERYIIPCNRLVREVNKHTKFCDAESFEELEERLKQEKKEQPSKIPYRGAILPQYPQHIVLAYVPKEKVLKEFIKVRPKGFYFHDKNFPLFQLLLNWFKENYSTRDYQRHFKRQKSPRTTVKPTVAPTQPQQQQPEQSNDYQQSGRDWNAGGGSIHSHGGHEMKQERSEQVCFNCNQPGHQKRDCPNERRSTYDRGQRPPRNQSPAREASGWGNNMKEEGGAKSPNAWASGGGAAGGGWGDQPMQESQPQPTGGSGWGNADNGGGNNWGAKNARSGGASPAYSAGSGAAGAGRGRGGGGGGRDCFKCGQEGHMARDCTNEDIRPGGGRGRGGGGSSECFKCHETGHFARECPNADAGNNRGGGGGGGNRACFKCGEEGHMARECPNNADGGAGGRDDRGRKCYKCNQEGHMARECTNDEQGAPYKRQRRDDGGSYRRDGGGDNNDNNNNDGGNWNSTSNAGGAGGDGGWGQAPSSTADNANGAAGPSGWGNNESQAQPAAGGWGADAPATDAQPEKQNQGWGSQGGAQDNNAGSSNQNSGWN